MQRVAFLFTAGKIGGEGERPGEFTRCGGKIGYPPNLRGEQVCVRRGGGVAFGEEPGAGGDKQDELVGVPGDDL